MSLQGTLEARDILVSPGTGDDQIDGRTPQLVAHPTSTAQVSQVLAEAHTDRASIAVTGRGTKQTWGAPAPEVDLLVDLSGMDALIEHQPGDLIASAQAGMPLAQLQSRLAPSGQRLGIDEVVPGTSIGGLIATNPSGPRRLHTGTVRDLIIGITVVRADGTVARGGGKVVKNVAGYDLSKLMTGAFGTLGVITEATFRLHPLPQETRLLSCQVPHDRLREILGPIIHSQAAPSAVEIDHEPASPTTTVAVLLEGTTEGVSARCDRMAALLGDGAHTGDLAWFGSYPFSTGGSQIGLKITCRLSQVADLATLAGELDLHVRGSAGTGVLYAAAGPDTDTAAVRGALETLRPAAARAGGSVVVVDGPRDVRGTLDVWGPINGLSVMRRIKDEFDPEHRLQAGRFVGGI